MVTAWSSINTSGGYRGVLRVYLGLLHKQEEINLLHLVLPLRLDGGVSIDSLMTKTHL